MIIIGKNITARIKLRHKKFPNVVFDEYGEFLYISFVKESWDIIEIKIYKKHEPTVSISAKFLNSKPIPRL